MDLADRFSAVADGAASLLGVAKDRNDFVLSTAPQLNQVLLAIAYQ